MTTRFILTFLLMASLSSSAQTLASFQINLAKPANGIDVQVSINLDEHTFDNYSSISLMEVQWSKKIPVPFQISQSNTRMLSWLIKPTNNKAKKYKYQLVNGAPGKF